VKNELMKDHNSKFSIYDKKNTFFREKVKLSGIFPGEKIQISPCFTVFFLLSTQQPSLLQKKRILTQEEK